MRGSTFAAFAFGFVAGMAVLAGLLWFSGDAANAVSGFRHSAVVAAVPHPPPPAAPQPLPPRSLSRRRPRRARRSGRFPSPFPTIWSCRYKESMPASSPILSTTGGMGESTMRSILWRPAALR